MSIENYICENCNHENLCKIQEKILPFHEDAKKDLGVTLIIHDCENYDAMEEEE